MQMTGVLAAGMLLLTTAAFGEANDPSPDVASAAALQATRMAVAKDPLSVAARRALAEVLLDQKQFGLARNVVVGAIRRGLHDVPLYALMDRIDHAERRQGGDMDDAAAQPMVALDLPRLCAALPNPLGDDATTPVSNEPQPRPLFDSGKLLATSGISQLEGAGGGGLAVWALITGYESKDGIGTNAHYTYVGLPDFTLHSAGAAIGLYDRVELSYAHEWFDTGATGKALGLGSGFTFEENVIGAKVRVAGDAIYDQDNWLPQIAVGAQYKDNNQSAVIAAIQGRSDHGVDFYVAATKLFLSESLLVDATVRATKANQFGILGFGGDRSNDYRAEFEGSAALLLTRQVAIGSEFRSKPDNLIFAHEDNAYDFFVAWFPTKNLSLTAAYVALGDIATKQDQNGVFLSIQAGL